jgi:hypothetical protein
VNYDVADRMSRCRYTICLAARVRLLAVTLGLVVLVLGRPPAGAAQQPHPFPDNLAVFTEYVESLRIQVGIPGLAAAIVGPHRLLWEQAFGYQDLEQLITTSPDTPFHFDGLTEIYTATILLECVEDGRLALDVPTGTFTRQSPEPDATIRQLLTHTSGPTGDLVFAHRPERIESLSPIVEECAGRSFRESLADIFDRLAMLDSVPGPDALAPRGEGPRRALKPRATRESSAGWPCRMRWTAGAGPDRLITRPRR